MMLPRIHVLIVGILASKGSKSGRHAVENLTMELTCGFGSVPPDQNDHLTMKIIPFISYTAERGMVDLSSRLLISKE